mgnify:CR=1 FL=1
MKVISLLVVSFSGFFADFVFEMSRALVILAYVNIAVRAWLFRSNSLYAVSMEASTSTPRGKPRAFLYCLYPESEEFVG